MPARTSTDSPLAAPPAWVAFLRGHSTLSKRLDALLREGHGLTLNEYEVLLHLHLAGEERLRRTDLAGRLLITQGGVTRLLSGLEARGLVRRADCESDRRVVYAELTGAGRDLAEAARRDHLGAVDRLFARRFTVGELEQLGDLLGRLAEPADGAA